MLESGCGTSGGGGGGGCTVDGKGIRYRWKR